MATESSELLDVETHYNDDDNNNHRSEFPPPPSFGSKLEKFAYAAATGATTAIVAPPTTQRITRASAKAQLISSTANQSHLKRKSEDPDSNSSKAKRRAVATTSPSSSPPTTRSQSSLSASPPLDPPKTKGKTPRARNHTSPTRYAHITNNYRPALAHNLHLLFIGVNPGIRTATTGHAYAHPSNLFYKLLHSSGCTPRLCYPSEAHALPGLYGLGNTNIVKRPTKDASELTRQEMVDGVAVLESTVREYKPEAVCLVGKGIWEAVWRARYGRAIKKSEFRYGWQDGRENMGIDEGAGWEGARVFVATSTSGLAAGLRPKEKEDIWRPLGEFVKRRRVEREQETQKGERGVIPDNKGNK
ncbi:MAG: hypothetical protein M1834_007719 [Cirrosporium novae-zelandiae]|nr:MAG: hypothetical protein M1834_007719 [Cirrosporium novae-zelandiae]